MFDAYHKWLGIPPKDQPPNHYRLLGIELFEADADVIDAAANKQMTYVQSCATGPHMAVSQKILNEIATARVCLLNPTKKSAYDSALKAKLAPEPEAPPTMPSEPVEEVSVERVTDSTNAKPSFGFEEKSDATPIRKSGAKQPQKKSTVPLIFGGAVAVGVVVILSIIVIAMSNRGKKQEVVEHQPEQNKPAGKSPVPAPLKVTPPVKVVPPSVAVQPVQPYAQWTFTADANDTYGRLNGDLGNGAEVKNGRLILGGEKGAYMATANLPQDVSERTLEAWVSFDNPSEITEACPLKIIADEVGLWDGIVFSPNGSRKWLAGSSHNHRSQDPRGMVESASARELIHVAISYRLDNSIGVYRNGILEDSFVPNKGDASRLQTYHKNRSKVRFGHTTSPWKFEVEEARLYDRALTDEEVALSYREFRVKSPPHTPPDTQPVPVPKNPKPDETPPTSLPKNPKPGDAFSFQVGNPPVEMKFTWVPPGEFEMGDNTTDSRKPVHRVKLTKGFWMGQTEVTQSQWKAVVGTDPSPFKGANRPVTYVTWEDSRRFCEKLTPPSGYRVRLPTEAEWEYACRAGTKTRYHSGDGEDALKKVGWYAGNSGKTTHPVGELEPNAWGLKDMHGNVWEWCQDWYDADFYAKALLQDPISTNEKTNKRIARGGSAYDQADAPVGGCVSTTRNWLTPSFKNHDVGLRVVISGTD